MGAKGGTAKQRAWYRFSAQADAEVAELLVYDEIGKSWWNDDAVSAIQFIRDLAALPESVKTLRVRVNSPGGNPFEALPIANALRSQSAEKGRRVEVSIEGLAASAATIVTSAGDAIAIARNAVMMIHQARSLEWGTAEDLRATAAALDRIDAAIVATYRWHSPLEPDELRALMKATTWMSAEEALANGLVTTITGAAVAEACVRPRSLKALGEIPAAFRAAVESLVRAADDEDDEDDEDMKAQVEPDEDGNCPEGYTKGEDGMCHLDDEEAKARARARVPASAADVLRECKAGGCLDLAEGLIAAKATLAEVKAKVVAARTAREQADARAREIRALCAAAKVPQLADSLIASAMPIAAVKTHLTTVTALMDTAEIDAGLRPDVNARHGINVVDVYREMNRRPAGKGA